MQELLQEYIAQHHELPLPGIGEIVLSNQPAKADFSEKLFYPPQQEWILVNNEVGNVESLINFIARKKQISTEEAKQQLGSYCLNIKRQLVHRKEMNLPGVGILKTGEDGDLQLDIEVAENMMLKPVMAERVIRKDATHTMLVGDKEKTNTEMNAWLNKLDEGTNNRWWAWAAAIAVIALGLILYSYSNNHWTAKGSGNQQNVTPIR
ncbi:MAG: hypothetical protein HYR66_13930 [Sphingobacteriales bacterium]|nr:hypothetical protein [Sphingobacteriales bacterium]MBI3719595.1 hypothetical protein [Sphingobacteriales bacterium]